MLILVQTGGSYEKKFASITEEFYKLTFFPSFPPPLHTFPLLAFFVKTAGNKRHYLYREKKKNKDY